jgi:hypothetical protein
LFRYSKFKNNIQLEESMKMRNNLFLKLILVLTVLSILLSFSSFLMAQSYYSGPASSSIAGGALVSTGTIENAGYYINPGIKVRNAFWAKYNPDYIENKFDVTPPAATAGSNEIIDRILNNKNKTNLDSTAAVVIDFESLQQTGGIPPDPVMAVGPNHVIACVNTSFAIYDKAGNELFRSSAEPWFNNVVPNNDAFDPQIIYDHFEGRWVQLWTGGNLTSNSYYLISVSDDDDPMGDWYNYAFPGNKIGPTQINSWPDYPKLGYDQNAIFMSGRLWSYFPNAFWFYSQIRWVSKSELYSANGGPVNYTDIWDLRDPNNTSVSVDGPPVAAVHLDSSDVSYLVVDSPYTLSNFATLWEIQNHFTTPIITATNIPTTAAYQPLDGQQLGGGTPIDVGRRVYRAAVYQDGSIWGAENIRSVGVNNATFARYIRIDVNSKSLLEDYALGAPNFYYLYPDIIVDEFNNMVMVYTRSGLTEYAGFGYTGRKDFDPAGYLAPTTILKEGEANYVLTGSDDPRNRWGDYMGIAQDPTNRGVTWALVEYAESPSSRWGTWIGAFTHLYAASGVVRDINTQLPIEFANGEVSESGYVIQTDSTGTFKFGAPTETINLNVSAFAYQDTVVNRTLTIYNTDEFDIELLPEIESTISGQLLDSLGNGVNGELKFYADGNPYPGAYATTASDTNGNYNLTTIIGNYDIEVFPESPYAYKKITDVNLGSGGLNYDITVSPADVMLVDDDGGMDYEKYYFQDLENIGKTYHHWDVEIAGLPTSEIRSAYPNLNVIWFTGDSSSSPLTAAEHDELLDHITTGGKLFLTGQDIAEMNSGSQLTNTIGVDHVSNWNLFLILGIPGDPVSSGLVFNTSGFGGANNQTSSDILTITDSVHTAKIFHYGAGTANPAGARYANRSTGSVAVFLGFGYESINDATRRQTLLTRVFDYLNNPLTGIEDDFETNVMPKEFALNQNYPNPFNPTTTIEFSVASNTNVKIYIYNSLGQRVITLLDKEMMTGTYKTIWSGIDSNGKRLSSGVYYYQMLTESGYSSTKKLLLLK